MTMTMTNAEIESRIREAKTLLQDKKQLRTEAKQFEFPHTVTRRCPVTGEWTSITVETADWQAWRSLESPLKPVTQFFPYLDSEEIEFLMSGISANGIQHLFRASEVADLESED